MFLLIVDYDVYTDGLMKKMGKSVASAFDYMGSFTGLCVCVICVVVCLHVCCHVVLLVLLLFILSLRLLIC